MYGRDYFCLSLARRGNLSLCQSLICWDFRGAIDNIPFSPCHFRTRRRYRSQDRVEYHLLCETMIWGNSQKPLIDLFASPWMELAPALSPAPSELAIKPPYGWGCRRNADLKRKRVRSQAKIFFLKDLFMRLVLQGHTVGKSRVMVFFPWEAWGQASVTCPTLFTATYTFKGQAEGA